jgi:hypothetical protein
VFLFTIKKEKETVRLYPSHLCFRLATASAKSLISFPAGFKNYTLMGSRPIDYDYNYMDGSPVVGIHPVLQNIFIAAGFNGRGAMYAPGVGRAITELMLGNGAGKMKLPGFLRTYRTVLTYETRNTVSFEIMDSLVFSKLCFQQGFLCTLMRFASASLESRGMVISEYSTTSRVAVTF